MKQSKNEIKEKVKNTVKKVNRKNVKYVLLKEQMSKKHKYILLGCTSIVVALFIYVGIAFTVKRISIVDPVIETIDLTEYITLSTSSNKVAVFIASKDHPLNQSYRDIIEGLLQKKQMKFKFLDLTTLEERNQIIEFMNVVDLTKENYIDPMILIFEEGRVKDSLEGIHSKKELESFFDKNRIE